jgi:hypothetical protein
MRKFIPLLLAGALLSTTGAAQAATDHTPQAQLARAIAGRVAGKPVDCINLRDISSSRIIDKTAILYDVGGGKLYVNSPTSGAETLRSDNVLVTDTHSSQLCSIDIVRLYDSGSRMQSGSVGLGQFVPYTKPVAARGS